MYEAGNPESVFCEDLDRQGGEGGGFRKEGTYVCLWPIHFDAEQKPSQYCKKKQFLNTSKNMNNGAYYLIL